MMQKSVTIDPSWFKHWFDSSFYHRLYANRDENEAIEFVDALVKELRIPSRSTILDLGCGSGRHSKSLGLKGFRVTGVDLSWSNIRQANKWRNDRMIDNVDFYQHDMRQPFGKAPFDYVFNFFTSFGYFTAREHQQVMANISASLRPGGTVVIDYLNPGYASRHLSPIERKEIDGVIYDVVRWEDGIHFFKKVTIDDAASLSPYHFTERVAKLRIDDFDHLFKQNGMRLQKVYGDYSLKPYDPEHSMRQILVAQKIW